MRFQTLPEWLRWQEQLHPKIIDLGLSRVQKVWRGMYDDDFACPVVTVAGTNGKGSCVAMLTSIYREAGYRVGGYTSPHLWRYNERICIDNEPVSDAAICAAFERVDQGRGETSLTYFEFGTLAAFDIFKQTSLDVILLEVGLGGRLDAVNIIDADVAIISSIDLDHTSLLGNNRDLIAKEKAGILRRHHIGIIAEPSPPAALLEYADEIGCEILRLGVDFHIRDDQGSWTWCTRDSQRTGLPIPALTGEHQLQNAAAAIMASESLQGRLPLTQAQIRFGLLSVRLPGRFQIVPGSITRIYDVAHNPAAALNLATTLRVTFPGKVVYAVFSALADKDINGIVAPLCAIVTCWFIAPLAIQRGADVNTLAQAIQNVCQQARVVPCASISEANAAAQGQAIDGDVVLVFGSFYTVAQSHPPGL